MNAVIRVLEPGDYPQFFACLNAQLAENGKQGTPLFQPVSRDVIRIPPEKEAAFVASLARPVGQPGWRRAWVMDAGDGVIMGHVDLRGYKESFTAHRALLGMGVGAPYRRRGLARRLLEYACRWVAGSATVEWLDIEVLAANGPALALYESAGFEHIGRVGDMYRIDGRPEDVFRMTRRFG